MVGNAEQQYIGVVKSFNPANGYGFVACDETHMKFGGDVFLHKSELLQCGASVGQHVKFRVLISDKGQPRAVSLQDVNDHGPPPPPAPGSGPASSSASASPPTGNKGRSKGGAKGEIGMTDPGHAGMYTGILKSFNQEKGYGFISCHETEAMFGVDIFLHFSEAIGYRVGDTVGFEVVLGPNGKAQARNLVQKRSILEHVHPPTSQPRPNYPPGNYGYGQPSPPNKGAMADPRSVPYGNVGHKKGSHPKGLGLGPIPGKEYTGRMKAFNPETGYGFIDCQEVSRMYARDAFIAAADIEEHGLTQGEEVVFTVEVQQGKPVAKVKCRRQDKETEQRSKIQQCGMGPHVGMIKSYNEGKGFGFIDCPATFDVFGQDVFLHKREMDKVNEVGINVQFNIQLSERGQPQAIDVVKVS